MRGEVLSGEEMPKINISFHILLTFSSKLGYNQNCFFCSQPPTPRLWVLPFPQVPFAFSHLIASAPHPGPQVLINSHSTSQLPCPYAHGLVSLSWKSDLESLQLLPFYSSSLHLTITFSGFEALSTFICSKPPLKFSITLALGHFKFIDNRLGNTNIGKQVPLTWYQLLF